MAREVGWTESAATDLEQIAEYIAKDSPFYAASVVRRLVEVARSLGTLAERGRIVPEYQDPAIREIIVYRYRVVYQVGEEVLILRIIHGAREFPAV